MKLKIAFAVAAATIAAASPAFAATNLVANGSFETGDFTGFTQFGNTGFAGVQQGDFNGVSPSSGSYQAFFGAVGSPGGLNLDLATTVGQRYNLSYDLANFGGGYNTYAVSFDAAPFDFASNVGTVPYTTHTYSFTGTGNDRVSFAFQNDPSYYLLDNVSVTAVAGVPETATWAMMILGLGFVGMMLRSPNRVIYGRMKRA